MTKGAPPRDRVYRRADLQRVLHPRSIAIVGASARQGAFGERVLNNLAGYAGNVHLVNPEERPDRRTRLPSESVGIAGKPGLRRCLRAARRRRRGRTRGRQGSRGRRHHLCVGVRRDRQARARGAAGEVVAARGRVGDADTGAELPRHRQLRARREDHVLGVSGRAAAARGLRRHRQPVGCAIAVARAVDRNRRLGEPHLFGRQPGRRRRRRPRCLSRGGGRVSLDRLRVRGHVAAATVARGGGSRVAQRQAAADPQDRHGAARFRSRCLAHRHARGLECRVPRCVRARGRDPGRGLRGADGGGCVLREGAAA